MEADEAGANAANDKVLPIANVARIMKRALPQNSKVANDAKECMQECVTEFILFITSEASERCAMEKRKTLTGEDILWAMSALSFDYYVEPLRLYLQRWREHERLINAKRAAAASAVSEAKDGSSEMISIHTGGGGAVGTSMGGGLGIGALVNAAPAPRGRPRGSKAKAKRSAAAAPPPANTSSHAGGSSEEDEDDADDDGAE